MGSIKGVTKVQSSSAPTFRFATTATRQLDVATAIVAVGSTAFMDQPLVPIPVLFFKKHGYFAIAGPSDPVNYPGFSREGV